MPEGNTLKQSSKQGTGSQSRKSNVSTQKTPDKPVDRTLGCRYEMKYLINDSKARAIAQYIQPYLPQDHYCKLQQSGVYPIVSLYLDSDDLRLYSQSLTGQKNRFKLRIRSYTDEPDYPCFFEIKRRMNTIIMKNRTRVMRNYVPTLLAGLPLPPQNYNVDEEVLNQFQLYMKSINAKPLIVVRYLRQAYEDDSHYRVRITFDREICYKATRVPEVKLEVPGWQRNSLTAGGGVILEIKFTARYPAWLGQMVEYFDLRHESISKYGTSIKQSWLLGFCAPQSGGSNYG